MSTSNTLPEVTAFDLDDTLYPELEFARSGLLSVGRYLESRFSCEGIAEALSRCLESGCRHRIFDEVLPAFELDLDLIPDLVELYRRHRPEIRAFSDVLPAIERARSMGPIALITDGPAISQRRKIEALGWQDRFDLIVVTDEAGRERWKPDPHGYVSVMQTFGAPGSRCTYVGDNPEKDFVAANALGWRTVQVERSGQMYRRVAPSPEFEAGLKIASLDELFR